MGLDAGGWESSSFLRPRTPPTCLPPGLDMEFLPPPRSPGFSVSQPSCLLPGSSPINILLFPLKHLTGLKVFTGIFWFSPFHATKLHTTCSLKSPSRSLEVVLLGIVLQAFPQPSLRPGSALEERDKRWSLRVAPPASPCSEGTGWSKRSCQNAGADPAAL